MCLRVRICELTANEMNRVRNLQCSNSILVYCSLPRSQNHDECECVCVHRVFYIPTIIITHFVDTVCGIFYNVFAVNASMQYLICMSKAIIVRIRDLMLIGRPTKWIYVHHHSTLSFVQHIQHVGHTMSSLSCSHVKVMWMKTNSHIFEFRIAVVTLKMRATWFMVLTYLLETIATKMKWLHFVKATLLCDSF